MVVLSQPAVLAEHLRRLRLAAHLTQEALAERAGLTARGIQNLERGVSMPYRDTVQRLVTALDLRGEDRTRFEAAATPPPRRRKADAAARVATGSPIRHLPAQLTPLIGRERELEEVRSMLRTARLVTLTGLPGAGKTRLALQVAADVACDFPDGVVFVALAPVRDPAQVVSAIAQVLGAQELGALSLAETVQQTLCDRATLLVLDNFEQVLAAAPSLTGLLASCPRVTTLITSRATLQVYGEHVFVVPPLELPNSGLLPPTERLTRYGAVRLFVERAHAVDPEFALTEACAEDVVAICRCLDGLPLAIELAASRIQVLPPKELRARLEHQLSLLTGGARDLPDRHQTLRHAIDWSYDLLDPSEQALLQRLSVFAGGATLEAVERVGGWGLGRQIPEPQTPHPQLPTPVLDVVQSLLTKSLIWRSAGDASFRVVLPESIREYATERLVSSGERDATRLAHAQYFLELAEAAAPQLQGPRGETWLDRLDEERGNVRLALRLFIERGDAERAYRLSASLGYFWSVRGPASEGRAFLAEVLALPWSAASAQDRAHMLVDAGCMAFVQGDAIAAQACCEESLALSRALKYAPGIATALNYLGVQARSRGEYDVAGALLQESLTIRRELGAHSDIGISLLTLGEMALYQGRLEAARGMLQESLEILREHGDEKEIGWVLLALGQAAREMGDLLEARRLVEDGAAMYRRFDFKYGLTVVLAELGSLLEDLGDRAAACTLLQECLHNTGELRAFDISVQALEGFACLAATEPRPERALCLAGAAAALRATLSCPPTSASKSYLERKLAVAWRALGDQAAAAWSLGQVMTVEEAMAYALETT